MSGPAQKSTGGVPHPEPLKRRLVGGPRIDSRRVQLKTVTPVLGGSSTSQELKLDPWDAIRAPSIRGHLRFWWRALHAHTFKTSEDLAARERALWGGVGKTEGARSRVELHVEVDGKTLSEVSSKVGQTSRESYALWAANLQAADHESGKQAAPRWEPGVCFCLEVHAPVDCLPEVELALRAWVLWGGYGSRTRRGLGSLTVVEQREYWLPRRVSRDELSRLFPGVPLFGALPPQVCNTPLLCGARLLSGDPNPNPGPTWTKALGWLREFRQGSGGDRSGARGSPAPKTSEGLSQVARDPGDSERPGRSHWPEADKIRQLFRPKNKKWAHDPRPPYASAAAAWPRAGFGLPLAIRFQSRARKRPGEKEGQYYVDGEPPRVELKWRDNQREYERLASPLIVKAMPLADGSFVPIALWLRRAWPSNGRVFLSGKHQLVPGRESSAPLDQVLPPGDTALYAPLSAQNSSLETIFLDWVKAVHHAKETQ